MSRIAVPTLSSVLMLAAGTLCAGAQALHAAAPCHPAHIPTAPAATSINAANAASGVSSGAHVAASSIALIAATQRRAAKISDFAAYLTTSGETPNPGTPHPGTPAAPAAPAAPVTPKATPDTSTQAAPANAPVAPSASVSPETATASGSTTESPSTVAAPAPSSALAVAGPQATPASTATSAAAAEAIWARLTPTFELKPRFEAMAPRDLKGGKLAYGILRSRFGIDAAVAGGWSAYLQLQDTRYFGGLRVADGFPPDITVWGRAPEAFDLHQGYTQWKRDCFAVRVGRQEITYGNERLIGTLDWANPGRTFDAVKFDYNKDAYSAAAFGAVLADSAPTSRGPDSVLAGSFFEHKRKGAINWGGIALYDATVHVTPSQRVTLGGRVWGPIGKLEFDIDAYGQVNKGKNLDATHAYLLGARAKYAFSKTHKGGFLIDYVSGASSSNAHAFHTLYGTNHKFYGFYDFFLNLPKDTGGQGLVDAALTGDWVIGTATLAAYAHLFGAATYNGAGSAWYGMEPDVVLGLPLVDKVKSEFGVSAFIPFGDALGRGDKMGWFSYAQLSIKL